MTDASTKKGVHQSYSLLPFSLPTKARAEKDYSCRADLKLESKMLEVSFIIQGNIDNFGFEEIYESGQRMIGLWERSCFEMFIKLKDRTEYFEFNFSAQGAWNCFHFPNQSYELNEYPRIKDVLIKANFNSQHEYRLDALFNLNDLGVYFFREGMMELNLAAVILNTRTGKKDYWALDHHDRKPNFHNFNCFKAHL